MSDELDVEQCLDLLTRLGNVLKRVETMSQAIGSAARGAANLPAGADLSGLQACVNLLIGVGEQTSAEGRTLIATLKAAGAADKSWGDHVKGWLDPGHTGHAFVDGLLDGTVGTAASVAAGSTDAVHDFGAGAYSLAKLPIDLFRPSEYGPGKIPPWARPGLGLLNLVTDPKAAGQGFIGWQFRDDPARMGTYALGNILATVATGGAGDAAEAGTAARLASVAAKDASVMRRLQSELDKAGVAAKQGRPRRGNGVQGTKRFTEGQMKLTAARTKIAELEAERKLLISTQAQRIAGLKAFKSALDALRTGPRLGTILPAVKHVPVVGPALSDIGLVTLPGRLNLIPHQLEVIFELSGIGQTGHDLKTQREAQAHRDRLREIATTHLGKH